MELFAQQLEVDIQSNRLFVDDSKSPYDNPNSLLIRYLPKFSVQKVLLGQQINFVGSGQKFRSFTLNNGTWGYNERGLETYYQNQYNQAAYCQISSSLQIDILQVLKDSASPNCFYLVSPSSCQYWNVDTTDHYLHLQNICVDKSGGFTVYDLDKIFIGTGRNSSQYTGSNMLSGFMARSNDTKHFYFHVNNPFDSSMQVYGLKQRRLAKAGSAYLPKFKWVRNSMSLSANSKRFAYYPSDEPNVKKAGICLHRLDNGYNLNAVPDTIYPYTYDSNLFEHVSYENVQMSPTGRFMYVAERVKVKQV